MIWIYEKKSMFEKHAKMHPNIQVGVNKRTIFYRQKMVHIHT